MDDDNAGQFRNRRRPGIGAYRPYQVSFNAPVALRRRDSFVSGLDPIIGPGHLLAQGIIRHQRLNNGRRRQAAHRQSLHTVQEVTPTHFTMNKAVVELYSFDRQFGFRRFHRFHPLRRITPAPPRGWPIQALFWLEWGTHPTLGLQRACRDKTQAPADVSLSPAPARCAS
jgi:hypothetical protein